MCYANLAISTLILKNVSVLNVLTTYKWQDLYSCYTYLIKMNSITNILRTYVLPATAALCLSNFSYSCLQAAENTTKPAEPKPISALEDKVSVSLAKTEVPINQTEPKIEVSESAVKLPEKQILYELSASKVHDFLNSHDMVVVDIWAPWCGPCKAYAKPFHDIAEKYKDTNVQFAKINFDETRGLLDEMVKNGTLSAKIKGIPETIYFQNGKEVYRVPGPQKKKVEEGIETYFLQKTKTE
jgi:thiol-disulfide isomerase/thioredoxin